MPNSTISLKQATVLAPQELGTNSHHLSHEISQNVKKLYVMYIASHNTVQYIKGIFSFQFLGQLF